MPSPESAITKEKIDLLKKDYSQKKTILLQSIQSLKTDIHTASKQVSKNNFVELQTKIMHIKGRVENNLKPLIIQELTDRQQHKTPGDIENAKSVAFPEGNNYLEIRKGVLTHFKIPDDLVKIQNSLCNLLVTLTGTQNGSIADRIAARVSIAHIIEFIDSNLLTPWETYIHKLNPAYPKRSVIITSIAPGSMLATTIACDQNKYQIGTAANQLYVHLDQTATTAKQNQNTAAIAPSLSCAQQQILELVDAINNDQNITINKKIKELSDTLISAGAINPALMTDLQPIISSLYQQVAKILNSSADQQIFVTPDQLPHNPAPSTSAANQSPVITPLNQQQAFVHAIASSTPAANQSPVITPLNQQQAFVHAIASSTPAAANRLGTTSLPIMTTFEQRRLAAVTRTHKH